MADPAMHPVRIIPHWLLRMSTNAPPPRLTNPEPTCLILSNVAT